MEHIKNMLAKLIVGKKPSEQDIKKIVLGKNAGIVDKITKHLEQSVNVAVAIRNEPKILREVVKNKAISEIFKYSKNKKRV